MPRSKKQKKNHSDSSSSSSDDSEIEFGEETPQKNNGSGPQKWSPLRLEEDSDDEEDDGNNEISLEDIKKKTFGRNIKSIYDMDSPAANINDSDQSKIIMDVTSFADGKTAANHLRQDLTCPICHDRLYNPVSLLCGHSFCETCLVWWMNEQGIQTEANDSEEEDYNDETKTGTCPTCRHVLPPRQKGKPLFCVNTALKACLDTLYGVEMNQRRMADIERKRKAIKGENGGLHQRGNEEIVKLAEECEADVRNRNEMNDEANGWVHLFSAESGNSATKKISMRRNVVMDDCDQRYQLSMGMTKCVYSRTATSNVVDVELCIIGMEEDEVDSGGFPAIIVEGSDDEALICTGNDRVHTCIQSSAVVISALETEKASFGAAENDNDALREVPLSRGLIGRDGEVRFRIDLKKTLDSVKGDDRSQQLELVKLKFCHLDTSLVLELRLPAESGDNAECNIDFSVAKSNDESHSSRFLFDDKDEEEEEMPDDYEDDGFIVNDSDHESESDNENDDCEICHNGGDLLVCDGGDHGGGCGKSFHVECIDRESVPEGEWICKACARELGLKCGIEGHEWEEVDAQDKAVDQASSHDALIDSDDEEVTVSRGKRRKVLEVKEDSDSDGE